MTQKDINILKKGVIEFQRFNMTNVYNSFKLICRDGYIGKVAAILENEFGLKKHEHFKIWPNEIPPYIFVEKLHYMDTQEIENALAPEPEPEPESEQTYEPYVIIVTLILFVIILSKL